MLTRITHHRSRIVALGVAVAIAVAALLPGAWGTALAQTAGTVTVTFTVDGTTTTVATTPDNLTTITIPPGARVTAVRVFAAAGTDVFATMDQATAAARTLATYLAVANVNTGFRTGSPAFQSADGTRLVRGSVMLNFTTPTSSLIGSRDSLVMDAGAITRRGMQAFQAAAPADLGVVASMTMTVSAEALADVDGDLSRIEVVYLNEFTGEAEPVTMLPSPGPGQVAFEWSKEGIYLLVTRPLVPLPPLDLAPAAQAVPVPADTGMGDATTSTNTTAYIALAGVLAAMAATGLGARFALRRTRG